MDKFFMQRALELAKGGIGYTNPNPYVGCIIVKNNRIIAEGYHKEYGSNHAEINAFLNAKEDVKGSTLYVNLEPCSHYGKTPPCIETIIQKKIKRVVIGMKDPNPKVSGKGIEILKDHGIEVCTGIMEKESKNLNRIFIHYITTKKPFCLLKTAMTLDGKIATSTGDSKWISNPYARDFVHHLRHKFSAIMVGIGTVLADDPLLTARPIGIEGNDPIRIIVDTHGRIPLHSRIVQTAKNIPTILATSKIEKSKAPKLQEYGIEVIQTPMKNHGVDLCYLFSALGKKNVDSILLEGGSTLNGSCLQEKLVHEVMSIIAPKIVGGTAKTPISGSGIPFMKDALILKDVKTSYLEDNILVRGFIRKEDTNVYRSC